MATNGWVRVDGDSPTRGTGVAFCEADGKKWQFIYADHKPGNYTLRFPPNSLKLAKVDNEESDSELELLVDNQMGYVTAVVPMGANDWREAILDTMCERGMPHDDAVAILDSLYPRPIPVSEKLPDAETYVLAFVPMINGAYDSWFIAMRSKDGSWSDDSRDCENIGQPSHWLPLPPEPKTPPAKIVLKQNAESTAFDLANVEITKVEITKWNSSAYVGRLNDDGTLPTLTPPAGG